MIQILTIKKKFHKKNFYNKKRRFHKKKITNSENQKNDNNKEVA